MVYSAVRDDGLLERTWRMELYLILSSKLQIIGYDLPFGVCQLFLFEIKHPCFPFSHHLADIFDWGVELKMNLFQTRKGFTLIQK